MTTRTKHATKRQAEATFRAFQRKYKHYDLSDASLIYDWTEGGHPAICWEGGDAPYCWAVGWDSTESPKGVFCEAYYGCVLAIYPDRF
jgi:hypothetical protein